jgi:uncharacterized membrane protein
MIAAAYAALTVLATQTMGFLAWGLVQVRVSEAMTVVAALTPAAIPGLFLGSVVANLVNLGQTGPLGWFDVVFGSLGSLLGAWWTWRFRSRTAAALAGPVIANALIVPAYLPAILAASGLYRLPVFGIDLSGSWIGMYLFGVVSVGLGQALVVYTLGWLLLAALRRMGIEGQLGSGG